MKLCVCLLVVFPFILHAQDTTLVVELRPLGFLLGTWVGEGSGAPGSGVGSVEFMSEAAGRVLVRRNHAEYPATADRPAIVHDDYMMAFRSPDAGVQAVYADNEGHVIHYVVRAGEDTVTMMSDTAAPGPRYRLSYRRTGGGRLFNTFEIAPPGKPDAFSVYVQGTLLKKP